MELTLSQSLLLGTIVSALVWIIRFLLVQIPGAKRFLTREVLSIVVVLASIVAAIFLAKPTIPVSVDGWINFIGVELSPIFGWALLVYNFIMKRLSDLLGDIWPRLSVR